MILDRLRRKKKPKAPTLRRSDFLRLKPVRSPMVKWEKNEKGEIKIIIPLKKIKEIREKVESGKRRKRKKLGLFSKLFPEPKEKRIQLDEIGSVVWELCDGNRTVKDIIDYLYEKYKLLPRESEISLSTYLNSLVKRGLVAFILPEDLQSRLEKEAEEEKS